MYACPKVTSLPTHTISKALEEAAQQFSQVTQTPLLDAEVLLAHLLKVQRSYLYAYPERILSLEERAHFTLLIQKRIEGQPMAYITGHCEFWSLDLMVTPATLIPRPETELLVESVLQKSNASSCLVADLGTGSGAIALALARERPQWTIYATDFSSAALQVAKANALRLQIENIIFCQGVWCEALPHLLFDMIVSNPPYIGEEDAYLQPSVQATEPASALFSGKDGLRDIKHIIHKARIYLKPGGRLLLEHGFSQGEYVRRQFLEEGYKDVASLLDFSGLNRVTTGIFGIE